MSYKDWMVYQRLVQYRGYKRNEKGVDIRYVLCCFSLMFMFSFFISYLRFSSVALGLLLFLCLDWIWFNAVKSMEELEDFEMDSEGAEW